MSTPMFAKELLVLHHDDRETVYEDVHYWPWAGGGHLDIFDEDGAVRVQHKDVLNTFVGVRP